MVTLYLPQARHLNDIPVCRIYPFLLLLILSVVAIVMQLKQFRKLYEHIKNDRYEISNMKGSLGE